MNWGLHGVAGDGFGLSDGEAGLKGQMVGSGAGVALQMGFKATVGGVAGEADSALQRFHMLVLALLG